MALCALWAPTRRRVSPDFALAAAIAHLRPVLIFAYHQDLRIGARTGAEVDGFATKIPPELGNIEIVAVKKRDAIGRAANATSSNLARAMPACPSVKFSMCAVPTLVTTPQSGAAIRAKAAISPGVIHAHFDDGKIMFRAPGAKAGAAARRRYSGCP